VRKPAPRSLGPALDGLTASLAPATTLARVQEVWERATGAQIAAAAQPSAEREGVLTVRCEAAVWAQELTLMEGDLVAKLNRALGEPAIRKLRCRTS
jgi:predicted nucleic acid-binding Zn ribbon protein